MDHTHKTAAELYTVKVTNVSKNTTESELQQIFSFYDSVSLASIKLNNTTNSVYNFAYVNYTSSRDADRAVAELNGFRNTDGVKFQVKLRTEAALVPQQGTPCNAGGAQNSTSYPPPIKVLLEDQSPTQAELSEFFSQFGELRTEPIIRKGCPDFTHINFKHIHSASHVPSGKVEIRSGLTVRIRPTPGSTVALQSNAQCSSVIQFDRKLIPCNILTSRILLSENPIYTKHRDSIAPVRVSLSKNSDGVILLGEPAAMRTAESCISLVIKDIQRDISQKVLKVPCMYIPAFCNPTTVSSILEIERKFSVEFLVCVSDELQHTQDIASFSDVVHNKLASQSEVGCLERFLSAEQSDPSVILPGSGISGTQPSDVDWAWENDEGGYTKYDSVLSNKINRLYATSSKGSFIHVISETATYNINLMTMTQTNTSTGHARKIRKGTKDSTLQLTARWLYHGDRKKMEAYSTTESQEIEKMYKSKIPTSLAIGGKLYTFDFTRMKQINSTTQYERDIERQPIAPQVRPQLKFKLKVSGLDQNDILSAESSLQEELDKGIVDQHCPLSQLAQADSAFHADISLVLQKYFVDAEILEDSVHIRGIQGYSEKISLVVRGKILDYDNEHLTRRASATRTTKPPAYWEPQADKVVLKEVGIGSSERRKVEQMFHASLPGAQIRLIQRVQNIWLWERYTFSKERMSERNQGIVNEKELFHGTRGTGPEKIFKSEQGFDFRFSSTGMWGTGTYFAVNASYSDRYAYSSASGKQIILALVLTGETHRCPPDGSLKKPPIKPKTVARFSFEDELYDSVSGYTNGSDVFIVYDHEKAYPSYLITYN